MEEQDYQTLQEKLKALLAQERNWLANLANACALLFQELPGVNWVGFYLLEGEELILGPFQGKPACVRIPLGKGVCGSAARQKAAIAVADVRKFPGHIACDPVSRSEIVIPLITEKGNLLGVLDVDSPALGRFTPADQRGLNAIAETLVNNCDWGSKDS